MKNLFLLFSFAVFMVLRAAPEEETRVLKFVQDDAQDYMVSKIYILKYTQANDLMPWVASMTKRYNMNSSVNCIDYGNNNQQFLTVTCPVGMMPYVDDFVRKADRDVRVDGHVPGDVIRGTGITRALYRPKYRSGQDLVNMITGALINEGPYGSVYGYDANSNMIYWKDNSSNTEFMYQFLGWLDRPAPQIRVEMKVYEVRESDLKDLGIEYLAWKNGPGLNIFQAGWDVFSLSSGGSAAVQALSGPMGGFFFAPQFDASFIRILSQSGNADIRNHACLTVSNSQTRTYSIWFNPELQNIRKDNNDLTYVGKSSISQQASQIYMELSAPVVCLHNCPPVELDLPDYAPGQDAGVGGTLFFGYAVRAASVVERNNYKEELVETSEFTGNASVALNREVVLASWDKENLTEQTIGIPWLCTIPVLKYLFGTTVTSVEKTRIYLTVHASMLNTGVSSPEIGKLQKLKSGRWKAGKQ